MSWLATRTSLEETVERLSRLLDGVADPSRPAVGTWSIAETAAHIREVATFNSAWATGGTPPPEYRQAFEFAGTVAVDPQRGQRRRTGRRSRARPPRADCAHQGASGVDALPDGQR